ncbi:MAG: CidA/LrgA family protein [Pseudomonadota bacterium]
MLVTFAVLLIFQCLGEGLVFALHLPIPGPVAGMLLLFCALLASPRLLEAIEASGTELLRHLSLLFVPAGVGIMVAAASIGTQWIAIALALVGSTLLTLAVTAAITRAVMARTGAAGEMDE